MAESATSICSEPAAARVWTAISLRRSGARPLRFQGALVVAAALPATAEHVGHSIRLFETSDGQIAVAMELWSAGCAVPTADARIVATAEELVAACESFDPRDRISADFSGALFDADGSGAAIKATIESRLAASEADYRATVLAILRDPHARPATA